MLGAGFVALVDALGERDAPDVAPLRVAGDRFSGVAVRADRLGDDGYRETARRVFGRVTPENELKWEVVHPERGRYDFGPVAKVAEVGPMRGHTLVWHLQNPAWLEQGSFSRDELIAIMRDHIFTVMRRLRNVREWDVVNEAVSDEGPLRDSVWLRGIGPDYIDLAFRFAREADPDARLYYNDYGAEGAGTKSRAVLALLRRLRARGVPVDGVGLQGHVDTKPIPAFDATLDAYVALGLDVVFTEVDVRVDPDAPDLDAQAAQYARMGRACVARPRCRGFVVWGVSDAESWVPEAYPGQGDALLFDDDLRPKPAYDALRRALSGQP